MPKNSSIATRRGFLCCCKSGGATTILGSLVAAGAMVGLSVYQANSDDAPTAETAALTSATIDDCFGTWNGLATGGNLPPEGVEFVLNLESDDEGGIIGTLDGGDQGSFDVIDGSFDADSSQFSCWIVNPDNPEMAAEMAGTVDNGAMSGSITAPDMEIEFDATKG